MRARPVKFTSAATALLAPRESQNRMVISVPLVSVVMPVLAMVMPVVLLPTGLNVFEPSNDWLTRKIESPVSTVPSPSESTKRMRPVSHCVEALHPDKVLELHTVTDEPRLMASLRAMFKSAIKLFA